MVENLIAGIIEGFIPLIGGAYLTAKLLKDREKKIYYLGPCLIVFAFLLVGKSVAGAERVVHYDKEGAAIVQRLLGGQTLPLMADDITRLDQIRSTSAREITYFYSITMDEGEKVIYGEITEIDPAPVLKYACNSQNLKRLYKNDYSVLFVYRNEGGKEIGRVKASSETC